MSSASAHSTSLAISLSTLPRILPGAGTTTRPRPRPLRHLPPLPLHNLPYLRQHHPLLFRRPARIGRIRRAYDHGVGDDDVRAVPAGRVPIITVSGLSFSMTYRRGKGNEEGAEGIVSNWDLTSCRAH